jgi:hypothetical protein
MEMTIMACMQYRTELTGADRPLFLALGVSMPDAIQGHTGRVRQCVLLPFWRHMLERGTDDLRNPYEQTLLKSGYGRVLRRVEHSVVTETSGLLLAHAHNAPVFVATHWLHETNPVLGIARHHYQIRILVLKRVGFPVVNQVRNGGDSSASEIKKQTKHLHVKNNNERFVKVPRLSTLVQLLDKLSMKLSFEITGQEK